MFQRLKEARLEKKLANEHVAKINAGLKHGKIIGELLAATTIYKLEANALPQGRGAMLCGYVYGFSDVLCQNVGLERGGPASGNALVAALNIMAPLSASTLVERYLVVGEHPHEFAQGMLKGSKAANSWLTKEAWSASLREIVTALVD